MPRLKMRAITQQNIPYQSKSPDGSRSLLSSQRFSVVGLNDALTVKASAQLFAVSMTTIISRGAYERSV